ncbi:MAG TPA: hypothetical protein VKH19_15845 [Gemmatimonadaceae bacterium]|nr:hypothetical protein [Gemmatimonadaceae bacterium]
MFAPCASVEPLGPEHVVTAVHVGVYVNATPAVVFRLVFVTVKFSESSTVRAASVRDPTAGTTDTV